MVNRYFGSKEGLFGEVVTDTMRDPVILSAQNLAAEDMARAFAEALVGLTDAGRDPLDVRKANLYAPGRDVTPFGMRVDDTGWLAELIAKTGIKLG